jgi:uncharacterized protein
MIYRRFGKTEVPIPVISCGGMRYQHQWQDLPMCDVPVENQKNLENTILRSLEVGINHIETARDYGSSEMQLGQILPKLPREKMMIQTKVAPYSDPAQFLKTFQKSLDYLGLEHVDFLSIHGINNRELLEWSLRPGGCLDAARSLQKNGRCRFVGFATHATTDIIEEAIDCGGFDYVNLHWYFVNDLNWSAIEKARKLDMGVFIISPNDKGGKLYEPPKKLVELCHPYSPMVFNDLYCLMRSEVHTLSCGAAKPGDFDDHLSAVNLLDKAHEIVPTIESKIRQEMNRVLGKDWRENWTKGLPNYVEVPGEVNIIEILRLWTYAKSLDLVNWGKMRYNLLDGAGSHWFPGKKVPVQNMESLAPALENSPFRDILPGILLEAHQLLDDAPKKRLSQGGE